MRFSMTNSLMLFCTHYIVHNNNDITTNIIVYRMEFDKTRWSCPWNSDKTVHKTLPGGGWVGGVGVVTGSGWGRGWWGSGVGG